MKINLSGGFSMTKLFILLMIATTFSISFVVADNVVQKKTDAALTTIKDNKDQFVKEMDTKIEKISQEIEDLRLKTKDKSNETIEKLENRKKDLQSEMKKLKKSSANAYEKVEDGVKKAWLNLKESVQAAKKEFE